MRLFIVAFLASMLLVTLGGMALAQEKEGYLLPPKVEEGEVKVVTPICTEEICTVPMMKLLVPRIRRLVPTLAPRRLVKKEVVRTIEVHRETRIVRGRYLIDRPGRRGPQRFMQRQPLRGLLRCRR
ncbi:hypothetical protein LCGC14_1535920 [marine sediment metagenome]|uniref:Uncharacterized protein n=1 Tax=marine sediment metagenome TaxID=412755 RepID=A0A0F9JFF0_9ZZZZ